jgi:GDPmannose 4,6-dehydratase
MPIAIITGITGQDGAYLAEFLLQRNYEVYGTYRRTSSVNFWRIEELGIKDHSNLHLVEYDLTDLSATIRLLERVRADEIYNLAAQSFVGVSFSQPITTAEITGIGTVNLLKRSGSSIGTSDFIKPALRKCLARLKRCRR